MAHLLISAAHKSSGKTTVSIGLCAALRARGVTAQPFKKGPDYIDALWLTRAAGRNCYNLDFHTMGREQILASFSSRSRGADLALIEGNKGLYDGLDLDGSNSNAALAVYLNAPVVLVLDVRGMTRGIAPLILGYQAFDPEIRISGVIFNMVGGSRHEAKLRAIIEHYTDVPVIGSIPREPSLDITERHLGLVPNNEARDAEEKIRLIGACVEKHVDIDQIRVLADSAGAIDTPSTDQPEKPSTQTVRIGIPRDAAFGFYYPDDLEVLTSAGAELVFFNSLRDSAPPAMDGLFIGGGFPETHMEALEQNASMRNAIKAFVESDKPVYAECGGLMYLARSLSWNGARHEMVGALPLDIVMQDRPVGRGYVNLEETGLSPWGKVLCANTSTVPAHEFHYSRIENMQSDMQYAFKVTRGYGLDGEHDGLIYRNVLASYSHLRNVGPVCWAQRFVEFVRSTL